MFSYWILAHGNCVSLRGASQGVRYCTHFLNSSLSFTLQSVKGSGTARGAGYNRLEIYGVQHAQISLKFGSRFTREFKVYWSMKQAAEVFGDEAGTKGANRLHTCQLSTGNSQLDLPTKNRKSI